MIPDFILNVIFIGKSSGFRLSSVFPSVNIIFCYEDCKESWWNRTDRKYRYTLPLYPPQIRYRLGNSDKMTE